MDTALLPNILNFLSTTDPFDTLTAKECDNLSGSIEILYLVKGDTLSSKTIASAGLYVVRLGAVEQRHNDASLRARLGSGDLFGYSQMGSEGTCEYTVTALEHTLLYLIPHTVLEQLIEENPQLQDSFTNNEGKRLAYTNQREDCVSTDTLYLGLAGDMVNANVVKVSPVTSIRQTASEMAQRHRSSALVMDDEELLGVVSDRDLTKRVVAAGIDVERPVASIMTECPITIDSKMLLINAVAIMMEHNVRSLPVLEGKKVLGVLTATTLIQRSRVQGIYLINEIYKARDVAELQKVTEQRQSVFETLVETGIHPRSVQLMMTLIADAFTRRLLQLAEKKLGPPPCRYAWIAAGSQARNEIHNLSDQDNGLILAEEVDEQGQEYFTKLADYVCSGLDACGYVFCPGNMMASNPKWCVPYATWEEYYRTWVMTPEREALLNICVFLDIRYISGDECLVTKLKKKISGYTKDNRRFVSILVANSLRVTPPLGMFRQFVLTKDGDNRSVFDIKRQAINLLVELARVYALAAETDETETYKRLHAAAMAHVISEESCKELLEAYYFLTRVRFSYQQVQSDRDGINGNSIEPAVLSQFERNHLKDSFRIISRTQEAASRTYNAQGMLSC